MALSTFSSFYYGYEIGINNTYFNFDEGSGELSAELNIGSFTPTRAVAELETALNAVGSLNYTVSFDRDTREVTISAASGTFDILTTTGSQVGNSCFDVFGFEGADKVGASAYTGLPSGSVYLPQFRLQDYIPFEHWNGVVQATVNKTSSGRVELIRFGDESFMQCNIQYATDTIQVDTQHIRNNPTGVQSLIDFMEYCITKGSLEFMPDENNASAYYSCLLESNAESKDGVAYKLRELYDKGLPGWYESGILKFRLTED